MSRPLRIVFSGALYHVTTRGNRREPIFVNDGDRARLVRILNEATARFDASLLAYCLMGNHYHLVLRTHRPNLSVFMRHVNGVYTQTFNHRHDKVGHVFQGRFKAILVDSNAYLLQVCRYVDLNPVRAGLTADATSWRWSSCRMHLGLARTADWLDSTSLLEQILGRGIDSPQELRRARELYAEFLATAGAKEPLWTHALRQQIYLGDDKFVTKMQEAARDAGASGIASSQLPDATARPGVNEIPRAQTRPPQSLQGWLATDQTNIREHALRLAHVEGGISLTAIARELGLSVSRVSRLVARAGRQEAKGKT